MREALRISLPANLEILHDTIAYLKKHVDEVIFDAEHFFDGYHANPEFAIACIKAVDDAGVDLICLCDTNGGRLPCEIEDAVKAAIAALRAPIGIHCHNDSEVAVANTIAAMRSGAVQVQGTINGLGERCGNANLVSIIGNLQLKLGYNCVPNAKLKTLQETSMLVYELANITPNPRQAYVGRSAFAHKAGLHVSGIQRNVHTYEHVDPALLGNDRRVLLSELSGRANILYKTREFGIESELSKEQIAALLEELKRLEAAGYTFDGADASFELLMLRTLGRVKDHFNFVSFRVFDDKWHEEQAPFSEAVVVIEGPDGAHAQLGHRQRPGQRARFGLAPGAGAVLSESRRDAAGRLQGPRARQWRRNRRARAGVDRIDRRQSPLGHGRPFEQRGRGELAGVGGFGGIQAAQGQRQAAHSSAERGQRCASLGERSHQE